MLHILEQVKSFYSNVDTGAGARQVSENIERIQMNINWKKDYEQSVTQWLQENSKVQ